MTAAAGAVEAGHGSVGALVNNAGYSQSGAIETLSMDDFRRQFETNVFGLVRMCQLLLPGMRRAGRGRIVNMSSMIGRAAREAYEKGPLARMGGEPDDVARAVEKAITARRAPIRMRVTPSAHVLVTQRRLMPDRVWDGVMATQFRRPGSS